MLHRCKKCGSTTFVVCLIVLNVPIQRCTQMLNKPKIQKSWLFHDITAKFFEKGEKEKRRKGEKEKREKRKEKGKGEKRKEKRERGKEKRERRNSRSKIKKYCF